MSKNRQRTETRKNYRVNARFYDHNFKCSHHLFVDADLLAPEAQITLIGSKSWMIAQFITDPNRFGHRVDFTVENQLVFLLGKSVKLGPGKEKTSPPAPLQNKSLIPQDRRLAA